MCQSLLSTPLLTVPLLFASVDARLACELLSLPSVSSVGPLGYNDHARNQAWPWAPGNQNQTLPFA